ncbi:hypothetical protein B0J11DRAFT_226703 [Dendryphion nanum]|uniref:DUF202 domain-containing protein n=1 Tax=Dendryphion nanum TaxID=256645 RepID=A0A9P9E4S6_9PLEO|nr:hypothetical protein B0J11DRAFT_226703 [Dendryphion nanum]
MSFLRRFRTPSYHNTGSTARDHLASERTYLSWLRTGLGFIALGIAIERFSQLDLDALLAALSPADRNSASNTSHSSQSKDTNDMRIQSRQGKDNEHVLVAALLGTGGGSILYGTARYFSNMRMLERGLFKPAYFGAAGLSITVAGLAGGVYVQTLRGKKQERDGA